MALVQEPVPCQLSALPHPPTHPPTPTPPGLWSYIIIADLAAACVKAAAVPLGNEHTVVYIAADDNAGGRDLAAAVEAHYGAGTIPLKGALWRPDASGIRCDKARALLGWAPAFSWRDFLGPDGRLKPGAPTLTTLYAAGPAA